MTWEKKMKNIILALFLCLPMAASAEYMDVIEFKLLDAQSDPDSVEAKLWARFHHL
jgi:hypothetical protein